MRLLIAEDHLSVAQGLANELADPTDNVTCATTPDEGERLLCSSRFDLIILDLDFRNEVRSGFHLLELARTHQPGTPALTWSMYADQALITKAWMGGARGFLRKSGSLADIRSAITTVLSGGTAFVEPPASKPMFTPRQTQVIHLLAKRFTRKEIAGKLGVSTVTVDLHIGTIAPKLGVKGMRAVSAEIERRALYLLTY